MTSPFHLLRRRQEILRHRCLSVYRKCKEFIIQNPLIVPFFGLIQMRFFKFWPNIYVKPFPFYEIPVTKQNPDGVIHMYPYMSYVHDYIAFIMIWIFCAITTPFKWQMILFIFLECMDLLDYFLRYNQSFMMVLGWDLNYTDLKVIFYALIILATWIRRQH